MVRCVNNSEEKLKWRQRRRLKLKEDNPSLAWEDIDLLIAEEERIMMPAPRCCACRVQAKREIVRVEDYLGPCKCPCHPIVA